MTTDRTTGPMRDGVVTLGAPATWIGRVGADEVGYVAELLAGADAARRLATAAAAGAFAVTVTGDWEGLPSRADLELLHAPDPVVP